MNKMNFIKNYDLETPVPKIIKTLDMGDYEEGRRGQTLDVWVNPSRMLLDDWIGIQAETGKIVIAVNDIATRLKSNTKRGRHKKKLEVIEAETRAMADECNLAQYTWYSKIWSQGDDIETHVSPADVTRFAEGALLKDELPLWKWVTNQTQAMIMAHLEGLEKN
ncbi:MAG: hypothetical protein KAJ07_04760 [Planctomycetes bacterium]|nr:hypothetical protein [Planctomycetota bacterium]